MATRGDTTNNSRRAVLETQELLENILYFLNPTTLILLRRTCTVWNHTIVAAPRLRRKTFLLGASDGPALACDKLPLGMVCTYASAGRNVTYHDIQINPLLFERVPATLSAEPADLMFIARPDFSRRGSIFHHMFLSQPPTRRVTFHVKYYVERPKRYGPRPPVRRVTVTVRNICGVRFGDLIREFFIAVGTGTLEHPSTGYALIKGNSTVECLGIWSVKDCDEMYVARTMMTESDKQEVVVAGA